MNDGYDLRNETLVALKEVPDQLPRRKGRKTHYQTVWRWAKKGSRGAVLETIRIGHIRYTSQEALQRFFTTHSPNLQVGAYQDGLERDLEQSFG